MQARLRFGWVMPGEVGYRVIGADGKVLAGDERDADRRRPQPAKASDTEWWDTAWGSMEEAGKTPAAGRRRARGAAARPRAGDPDRRRGDKQPKQSPRSGEQRGRSRPLTSRPTPRRSRRQLGRPPRDSVGVAHRCPCGNPDVVATAAAAGRRHPVPDVLLPDLPAGGLRDRHPRGVRPDEGDDRRGSPTTRSWRPRYRAAHEAYLADRGAHGDVPEIDGVSAGGMPESGQVPARPGRARAGRRAGRQPARRRGARPAARLVGGGSVRPSAGQTTSCGGDA